MIKITDEGKARFAKTREKTQQEIERVRADLVSQDDPSKPTEDLHWPLAIRIGKYEIKTWYSAPFPQEFSKAPMIFFCEFCLNYMDSGRTLANHKTKCLFRHPPGNEIYRKGTVSVFEVDGNVSPHYCQNLCLLAKLFLDSKALFNDVERFLFYVVTSNDNTGFHFVGYFSKQKNALRNNLCCVVTLPNYQKQGYGRFLIDFSFLLSRKEGVLGTPERPLSDLGRITYASYWRTAIFEWIHANIDRNRSFKLIYIAEGTGIAVEDIVEVFDSLEWFRKQKPKGWMNWSMIDAQAERAKADKSRIIIDPDILRWTPTDCDAPSEPPSERSPVARLPPTVTGPPIAARGYTIKNRTRSLEKKATRKSNLAAREKPAPPSSEPKTPLGRRSGKEPPKKKAKEATATPKKRRASLRTANKGSGKPTPALPKRNISSKSSSRSDSTASSTILPKRQVPPVGRRTPKDLKRKRAPSGSLPSVLPKLPPNWASRHRHRQMAIRSTTASSGNNNVSRDERSVKETTPAGEVQRQMLQMTPPVVQKKQPTPEMAVVTPIHVVQSPSPVPSVQDTPMEMPSAASPGSSQAVVTESSTPLSSSHNSSASSYGTPPPIPSQEMGNATQMQDDAEPATPTSTRSNEGDR